MSCAHFVLRLYLRYTALMRPTAQIFWKIVYVVFPVVRDTLIAFRIVWRGKKRQPFSIGYIKGDVTIEMFRERLLQSGFEKNSIAWVDYGEVLSMRKIDPIQPHCHYHIRLFKDGEVCGHYEKMPEKHPIDYFRGQGMLNRPDYFRSFIYDLLSEVALPDFLSEDIADVPEKVLQK